ncbi:MULTISPECIES: hypothetical protein [unclassified Sphingomonas]|uniref:DUF7697 family protein n=1 Tax=unclassified Sphingomonas TaxID=196159 RepID=UPI002269AEB7|nr:MULTISPECIES: hypothetical protein [unclassified Sphingomonas]
MGSQLRLATIPGPEGVITRPVGLDFGAVMLVAQAAGVAGPLLADLLPQIEAIIINPPEGNEEADHGDA